MRTSSTSDFGMSPGRASAARSRSSTLTNELDQGLLALLGEEGLHVGGPGLGAQTGGEHPQVDLEEGVAGQRELDATPALAAELDQLGDADAIGVLGGAVVVEEHRVGHRRRGPRRRRRRGSRGGPARRACADDYPRPRASPGPSDQVCTGPGRGGVGYELPGQVDEIHGAVQRGRRSRRSDGAEGDPGLRRGGDQEW